MAGPDEQRKKCKTKSTWHLPGICICAIAEVRVRPPVHPSKHAAMAVRRLTIIRTAAFCCWSSAKHTRRTPLCRRMNGEPQDARRRERGARSKSSQVKLLGGWCAPSPTFLKAEPDTQPFIAFSGG